METASCWATFDRWIWDSKVQTREQKAENHIKSVCNENMLACTRAISLIITTIQLILQIKKTLNDNDDKPLLDALLLTNIALFFTLIYFFLALIAFLKWKVSGQTQGIIKDGTSPFFLWKWCQSLSIILFVTNLMITLGYWLVLYPGFVKTGKTSL